MCQFIYTIFNTFEIEKEAHIIIVTFNLKGGFNYSKGIGKIK
jgi:hypothetical protein